MVAAALEIMADDDSSSAVRANLIEHESRPSLCFGDVVVYPAGAVKLAAEKGTEGVELTGEPLIAPSSEGIVLRCVS